jgi:anti-sigma regulatory factor (Ser/Thr protein kinase)
MSGSERTWTLPHQPSAMAEARRLVADMCHGMPVERVDVARLLVSELTMNALQHGSGEMTLVVVRDGGGLRVEVHDQSRVMPVLVVSPSLRERGWGLQLVAAFANSWGATAHDDVGLGKQVWFTLS